MFTVCVVYTVHTYESLLLQIGQVSQRLQVSLISVIPPVELNTVQTVHLHSVHGALQSLFHHLHTDTRQLPFLLSTQLNCDPLKIKQIQT